MTNNHTNMTSNTKNTATLLLVTVDPSHPLAKHALRYAEAFFASENKGKLMLFFYGEAARIANRLNWHTAEQINVTQAWQDLHNLHGVNLPVCVSTALSRGISDSENGARHRLDGENLAIGFELVGLGVLAEMMHEGVKVVQF